MIPVVLVSVVGVAQAAAPAVVETRASAEQIGTEVGALMARHDWRGALALLEALPPNLRATPDVQFVEAFLDRRLGRHDKAVELYQRMLDGDTSLLRVRLELADTFLESGDDRSAEHNYRLALASEAAETVRPRIEERLKSIAERRHWRYSLDLAVAPDSNVNAATDARETQIFGLPFELSDEARRKSGLSLNLSGSAERSVPLKGAARLSIGGYGRFVDNEQKAFDDATVGARVGPQFWLGQIRGETQGLVERRWYGGAALSTTTGVLTSLQWGWDQVQRRAVLSAQHIDYDVGAARDGWLYGVVWERTRFLSATRFWRMTLAGNRVQARTESESFWLGRASAGLYQTLPAGLAVWVEPSIECREYDAPGALNPVARRDTEIGLAARLVKRDWRYRGFSPYVGVEKSRNASNLDIEDYARLKVEFGATRTF